MEGIEIEIEREGERSQNPEGSKIPSGRELRPLCVPRRREGWTREERERDWISKREAGRERSGCHVMKIIPSTFLQYIPLSVKLIFIFIVAEAAVLFTFMRMPSSCIHLNVLNLLLSSVLSARLWLWLSAAPICILSLVTWKAERKMRCSRRERKNKGTWRSEREDGGEGKEKVERWSEAFAPLLFSYQTVLPKLYSKVVFLSISGYFIASLGENLHHKEVIQLFGEKSTREWSLNKNPHFGKSFIYLFIYENSAHYSIFLY